MAEKVYLLAKGLDLSSGKEFMNFNYFPPKVLYVRYFFGFHNVLHTFYDSHYGYIVS